jgi:hypothetical protein
MYSFTYRYQGQMINTVMDHYIIDGYDYYRIEHDGDYCTIMASGKPNMFNKMTWVQIFNQSERIGPRDLIQAMGEGLLEAGIGRAMKL